MFNSHFPLIVIVIILRGVTNVQFCFVGLNVAEVSSNPAQLQLQTQLVVEEDALASWDSLNQVNVLVKCINPCSPLLIKQFMFLSVYRSATGVVRILIVFDYRAVLSFIKLSKLLSDSLRVPIIGNIG